MAVDVNYWVNPHFVLKLSYLQVDGNLFAFPGEEDELLEINSKDERERWSS